MFGLVYYTVAPFIESLASLFLKEEGIDYGKARTWGSVSFTLVGIAAAVCAGMFPLASIASFLNICTLAYLMLLAVAILKLRKDKGLPQAGEFKTPLVPLTPILSIIICLSFMSQYGSDTWLAFGLALLVGTIIYFVYGYHHSEIN